MAVAFAVIQFFIVKNFNESCHTVSGPESGGGVSMTFSNRGDNTSSWVKDDFVLDGEVTLVTGETVDGVISNNSGNEISSWTMRFDVPQECFINQAWNGTLEIHQYVGTQDECVQTLSLQKYELDEIALDHMFDGNLYIPLEKGDFFIYYPSEKFDEINIEAGDDITIGAIFYHKGELSYDSFSVDYYLHRNYTDGICFILLFFTCILLVFFIGMSVMSVYIFRRAEAELRQKISGISCMSEVYEIVYMVDLQAGRLSPVKIKPGSAIEIQKADITGEQFISMLSDDATAAYRSIVRNFADLSTVTDRMEDRHSISCEYISKSCGWCRIRFIGMDRETGKQLTKLLFTVHVIEREKQEMDEIRGRVEKAESENRAKSTFLANMSHEIRTPINTVLGLDTMILRESKDSKIRGYAKLIRNAGNLLLEIINGILDFSKLESGKMELVPAEYSLRDMIVDVKSITSGRFADRGLDFLTEVDEKLPAKLYGDDVRLKQVLINLLTNAAKYTDSGYAKLSVKEVSRTEESVKMLVSVEDTGIGIRKENIEKLSERFTRLDEERNRTVEGTGIGINLITGFLGLMNSKINIESEYGKGSRFFFEIEQGIVDAAPVGKTDWSIVLADEGDDFAVSFTAPNARVLVVDDNEMNLMVFKNLLADTKLSIDAATSGRIALSNTFETKYDIIFMDHMMPEMDGIQTMQAIKSQDGGLNHGTPEIILTANAVAGAKEEFLGLGFSGFIAKPINPALLEQTIMDILPENLYEKHAGEAETGASSKAGDDLPVIEGVDTAYALTHIGSLEGVVAAMKQFVTVSESETKELGGYVDRLKEAGGDEEALAGFRIKVHAMKTSAALVGGLMVYGSAAQLEMAARDANVTGVVTLAPYFIDFWNLLRDRIAEFLSSRGEEERREEIDREKLSSLVHQLETCMNAYDVKNADRILEELEKYGAVPEIESALPELRTAVANLDAQGCTLACRKITG